MRFSLWILLWCTDPRTSRILEISRVFWMTFGSTGGISLKRYQLLLCFLAYKRFHRQRGTLRKVKNYRSGFSMTETLGNLVCSSKRLQTSPRQHDVTYKGHIPNSHTVRTEIFISWFIMVKTIKYFGKSRVNPLKPELNPICYLLALLAHHFLHVSRIRVK